MSSSDRNPPDRGLCGMVWQFTGPPRQGAEPGPDRSIASRLATLAMRSRSAKVFRSFVSITTLVTGFTSSGVARR